MRRTLLAATLSLGLLSGSAALTGLGAATAAASVRTYQNCTALQKVYPHGVGRQGARDKTSGRRVTNFKVSNSLYDANRKSDRDRDGIACERR